MADYYDLPELVKMCKEAFEDLLTADCVLKELADSFARLHEPIRTVIESYALRALGTYEVSLTQPQQLSLLPLLGRD